MVDLKKLKVLHLLSQRPDSTGSGIYVQAMMREANACGYDNFLVQDKLEAYTWAGIFKKVRETYLSCF